MIFNDVLIPVYMDNNNYDSNMGQRMLDSTLQTADNIHVLQLSNNYYLWLSESGTIMQYCQNMVGKLSHSLKFQLMENARITME